MLTIATLLLTVNHLKPTNCIPAAPSNRMEIVANNIVASQLADSACNDEARVKKTKLQKFSQNWRKGRHFVSIIQLSFA